MADKLDRRLFLKGGMGASALAAGLGQAARADEPEEKPSEDGGALVALPFASHERLDEVGGSARAAMPDQTEILVAHVAEKEFVCCGGRCTHANGVLAYDHEAKQFVCADHGSRFDLTGQVVQGPATKPVPIYPTDRAVVVREPKHD